MDDSSLSPVFLISDITHPMWAPLRDEAAEALPAGQMAGSDDPLCLWRSEDYTPKL